MVLRGLFKAGNEVRSDQDHLQAAVDWLCRAQEVTGCGGVSAGYFFKRGWMPPYPEVTGYIIPTFLRYARLCGSEAHLEKALRMGEWEVDIQLPCGGVRGGIGLNDHPIVFNTGQVVLGWMALYRATGAERFLQAATRASDWLLRVQDEDGKWSKHAYMGVPHTYHARVAWALLEVYNSTRDDQYRTAAQRNIEWILTAGREDSWFRYMSFAPRDIPFTHTIAYTLRGLLEAAIHLGGDEARRILEVVTEAAQKIMLKYGSLAESAYLPATLDKNLESRDRSSCLVGNAQLAIVWLKLCRLNQDFRFARAAFRLLDQVKRTQSLDGANPGIRGGIAGSRPVWGRYVPYAYLSWAAKFYVDGLILKREFA